MLTWGGTWGAAKAAHESRAQAGGARSRTRTCRHMNPFPSDLGDIVQRYPKIFVPEINLGQLSRLIRAEFLVDARSYGKMFGVPFHAADLEERILEMMDEMSDDGETPVKLARKDFQSDQEVRWCPGCGDYGILTAIQLMLPETGIKPEEPRVRVGHRLRGAPAVLHEHVRHSLDPRSCARGRDRCRAGPARPQRVGHRRRRRHAVDRRQPPHPRAAPQREHEDPHVQQPDLRSHQGPVLADQRDGQGHEVDAVRLARPARSTRSRSRSVPRRRSSPAPTTWTAST